ADALEQLGNLFQHLLRIPVDRRSEANGRLGASIHLDGCDVFPDLVTDEFAIALAAATAVLLIHPESHADGAARLETQLLDERHGLETRYDRRSIILCALSHIPR